MKLTFLLLAVGAVSTVANAGIILSTGLNSSDILQSSGTDGNYFVSGPGISGSVAATIVTSNPGWYNTSINGAVGTPGADWISIASNGGNGAPGLYTFTDTFTATAGTFSASGFWATDDCGSILVNGVAATGTGTTIGGGASASCTGAVTTDFSTLTPFTVNGTLTAGTNTISFQVYNGGVTNTPLGLLVDTSAPEPSSVLSVLTGLALVGAGLRRRRVSKQ